VSKGAKDDAKKAKRSHETHAGIPISESYTSADLRGWSEETDLGKPGEYPFTRGVQKNMYRGRLWTMRQYAGFGTAAESNQRYHYLLSQGQSGLSVAFDLPTQMGRDSDHALSLGEVGKVGVAIDSLEDMQILLEGLPLDQITTSMTINATAATLLSLYVAVGDNRGIARDKLGGTIQNDILKEYIARGTYIYPPRPSMRVITDVFEFCRTEVPRWNTISISGYHIREAGSDAVQEVAFTLADGIAYVDAALRTGQKIDEFAPRLAFFFNGHNNFLEEVAKFRAARRMWAKIMKERFGAKDPKSLSLRFHTQTAGVSLMAQQPLVNVARVTVQALAAVLGGTQSLHTNAYDEALGLPTEESARIALRTQQVIAYESGVADFVDPLAGSYAVEHMTSEIEKRATEYIQRIDQLGGMVAAIEQAYPQREIERRAYEHQQAVERKERVVVGVNEFAMDEASPKDVMKVDPKLERDQVERVRAVRQKRDAGRAKQALAELAVAAKGTANVVPRILEAVKALCTVGEVADTLRDVYGEYRPTSTL
jgi:methylmalonyl-CoA mutase N-terminal domain/subunit